ncbi:MAG: hypothetical protein LBJ23_04445 [Tannerella sp.]|nr:hypothetical protein [Tannerella sp.]
MWEQTQGQPWLVNAIAREVTVEMLQSDFAKPVTSALAKEAIQTIILRRELVAETGRLDLCIVCEGRKYPLELKLWRGEKTLEKGIEQTLRYMDAYGCTEGWLAVFDRRPEMKWDDKLYMRKEMTGGKTVTIVGL